MFKGYWLSLESAEHTLTRVFVTPAALQDHIQQIVAKQQNEDPLDEFIVRVQWGSHDAALGARTRLGVVLHRRRHAAGHRPHRLSGTAAVSGDAVVTATAIAVLIVALIGAALVSWWVWQGGTDS